MFFFGANNGKINLIILDKEEIVFNLKIHNGPIISLAKNDEFLISQGLGEEKIKIWKIKDFMDKFVN